MGYWSFDLWISRTLRELLHEHYLWLIVLLFSFLWSHFFMITFIPKFLASKLCGNIMRKLKEAGLPIYNTAWHNGAITSNSRAIIIPCPDFLYTVAICNLRDDMVILLTLPVMYYQNVAFYDECARCVFSASFINHNRNAVIVGPDVRLSDDEILETVANSHKSKELDIIRLPVEHSFFMHRLFMHNIRELPHFRKLQESIQLTEIAVGKQSSGSSGTQEYVQSKLRQESNPVLDVLLFLSVISAVIQSALAESYDDIFSVNHSVELIGLILSFAVVGAISSVVPIKLIRSGSRLCGIVQLFEVGTWKFSKISVSQQRFNPYLNLFLFFFGAYGLPNAQVMYGGTKTDSEGEPLTSEGSYLLESDTCDFHCEWFSITAYGHDQFLIPNPEQIYSVNSKTIDIYRKSQYSSRFLYKTPSNSSISHSSRSDSLDSQDFLPAETRKRIRKNKKKRKVFKFDSNSIQQSANGLMWNGLTANPDGFRIYASARRPDKDSPFASLPWLPLKSDYSEENLSGEKQSFFGGISSFFVQLVLGFVLPRARDSSEITLMLRCYSPDPTFWQEEYFDQLPLPTISRVG